MAKTRTTKSSTKTCSEDTPDESTKSSQTSQLRPDSTNPPQIFLLPEESIAEARIVTLRNPRYLTDSRYLICPEKGFFEFTSIAAPTTSPRSWLLSTQYEDAKGRTDKENTAEDRLPDQDVQEQNDISKGYVTKSANLLVATPFDPLFLILPVLSPNSTSKSSEPAKKLFLSGEDYLDQLTVTSPHLRFLLRTDSIRARLESRMAAVCDTVDAGDECMYRINDAKLLNELFKKAQNMTIKGLPESMEEKFIRRALEVPVLSIKRDESFLHELRKGEEEDGPGPSTPMTESAESQTSASTAATSFSSVGGTDAENDVANEVPKATISAPEGVPELLRLRTAFNFLLSAYLPLHLHASLKSSLSSTISLADFSPLDVHLAHLAKLRQEAVAARSLNDMNRKRAFDDEEEEIRAEKKRRKEEEDKKKKAGESRGVKNLKKVNVSGMKKMSDFFKKKA